MANAWMDHVKVVRKANPSKSLKEVLKMAGKSYKKSGASKKVTKTAKKPKMVRNMAKKPKTARKAKKSGKKGKKGKKSRGRK